MYPAMLILGLTVMKLDNNLALEVRMRPSALRLIFMMSAILIFPPIADRSYRKRVAKMEDSEHGPMRSRDSCLDDTLCLNNACSVIID